MNTIAIDNNNTAMDVVEVVDDSYLTSMDAVDDSYLINMDVVDEDEEVQVVTSFVNVDSEEEEEEEEDEVVDTIWCGEYGVYTTKEEEEEDEDDDEEVLSSDEDEDDEEEEEHADEVKYNIVEEDAQLLKECLTGGYKITYMLGLDFVSIIMCIYILLNVTNPYFIVAFVCVGVGFGLFKIAQVTDKLSDEIIKLREENANLLLFIQK